MAQLTVQETTLDGSTVTYATAGASGDTFSNDGDTTLRVKNGGASSMTVTVSSLKPCDQGFTHDIQDTVPAGGELEIGPFSPVRFNDKTGNVSVSYSAVTTVTVAAVR